MHTALAALVEMHPCHASLLPGFVSFLFAVCLAIRPFMKTAIVYINGAHEYIRIHLLLMEVPCLLERRCETIALVGAMASINLVTLRDLLRAGWQGQCISYMRMVYSSSRD